jgi:dihydrofolate synthase/folylpolyglutamate synthase
MNYNESIAYIESLVPTLERPTLARMQLFMQEEGGIQDRIKCFHVGGTNGKGSTATILDAVLSSTGLKVGKFTGPHIMRFNERFSIAGQSINDEEFAEIATSVRQKSEAFGARHEDIGHLTWFEFLTAMAFFYFWNHQVDCAVLEVGLGGRFDATNVANNVQTTVITNIDLDHMHILGDTVTKIAFEKAGIMRKDVPVITCAEGEALEELRRRAQEAGTKLFKLGGEKPPFISAEAEAKIEKALQDLSLTGPHQQRNARMAIAAVMASPIGKRHENFLDKLSDCLNRIYFPGRMQAVPAENLIMDGAHNPAGAKALRKALDSSDSADGSGNCQPHCFVLGLFGNKDAQAYLKELLVKGDCVVAVEAEVRRSTYPKEQIVAVCEEIGIKATPADSMEEALKLARAEGLANEIIVAGSFAVLKELMLFLGWHSVEDGRKSIAAGSSARQSQS